MTRRPVIGICNTWSELTPCNAHLRDFADHVKRGVWEAGGLPVFLATLAFGALAIAWVVRLVRAAGDRVRRRPLFGERAVDLGETLEARTSRNVSSMRA